MRVRTAILGACLLLSAAVSAHASPIYLTGNSAGTTTTTAGAVTFADFDLPLTVDPAYATITGGTLNGGTNPGVGGNWLAVPPVVTITFTGYEDYFGFYWGTNDGANNQVNLFDGTTLLATITGNGLNAFFNITALNSEALFDRITLTSSGCCFEVDNLAVRQAPEPASLLLLGTGIAAVARRRFKKRS